MRGARNIDKFYEALSKEVDAEIEKILNEKYPLISEHKQDAAKWCQDRMLYDCVPENKAAHYLKAKHGIDVVLLPEPELSITLSVQP